MDSMEKSLCISLLQSTNREGMDKLLQWMEENEYYTSPSSTKFHGAYEGGLLIHSVTIYQVFKDMVKNLHIQIPEESIIICSLLHDACKVNYYIPKSSGGYTTNKEHPAGHCSLSVKIIEQFIKLTDMEKQLISFHMGMYSSHEFMNLSNWSMGKGEYTIKELSDAWNENKVAKMFYFADEIASFIEK